MSCLRDSNYFCCVTAETSTSRRDVFLLSIEKELSALIYMQTKKSNVIEAVETELTSLMEKKRLIVAKLGRLETKITDKKSNLNDLSSMVTSEFLSHIDILSVFFSLQLSEK